MLLTRPRAERWFGHRHLYRFHQQLGLRAGGLHRLIRQLQSLLQGLAFRIGRGRDRYRLKRPAFHVLWHRFQAAQLGGSRRVVAFKATLCGLLASRSLTSSFDAVNATALAPPCCGQSDLNRHRQCCRWSSEVVPFEFAAGSIPVDRGNVGSRLRQTGRGLSACGAGGAKMAPPESMQAICPPTRTE